MTRYATGAIALHSEASPRSYPVGGFGIGGISLALGESSSRPRWFGLAGTRKLSASGRRFDDFYVASQPGTGIVVAGEMLVAG